MKILRWLYFIQILYCRSRIEKWNRITNYKYKILYHYCWKFQIHFFPFHLVFVVDPIFGLLFISEFISVGSVTVKSGRGPTVWIASMLPSATKKERYTYNYNTIQFLWKYYNRLLYYLDRLDIFARHLSEGFQAVVLLYSCRTWP